MIKDIITDKSILSKKCIFSDNYKDDIKDLLDTAYYYNGRCVGLAANQINSNNRLIVIKMKHNFMPMVNPKFIRKFKTAGFKTKKEKCLSLPRSIIKKRRYKKIKISYLNPNTNQIIEQILVNQEARIFQHEMDHLEGILI